MKKLFTLLALSALLFTGLSCSSDDNALAVTPPVEEEIPPVVVDPKDQVTFLPHLVEVETGTTVRFAVMLGKQATVDFDLYVNQVKQDTTAYTFDKVGTYIVVAKKEGYKDSNEHKITAMDKLIVSPKVESEIVEGTMVEFTVKTLDGTLIEGADILLNNQKVTTPWKAVAGNYDLRASKQGYIKSEPTKITVKQMPALFITNETSNNIIEATQVLFEVVSKDGRPVEGVELFIGDNPITNPWKATVGTHQVIAKKQGYQDSKPFQIIVIAKPKATGHIYFENKRFETDHTELAFVGFKTIHHGDPTQYAVWRETTISTDKTGRCEVFFATPAIVNEDFTYTAIDPSMTKDITWMEVNVYINNRRVFAYGIKEQIKGRYRIIGSDRPYYINAEYFVEIKDGTKLLFSQRFNGERKVYNYTFNL
ncbi:cupredoxin domain-containing protein [Myroides pelagicus]|uniref:PEGA domain-containing protein n=1 Tax=Myroides pelagicus TaxID=270914 RepID=A0A7K1GSS2_9FLAO|nr:hypothetical protein [Myroides pelagicus]MTH30884.1 hypothetical protein [Myroides pelagicus]